MRGHSRKGVGEAKALGGNVHGAMELNKPISKCEFMERNSGIKVVDVDCGLPKRVLNAGLGS